MTRLLQLLQSGNITVGDELAFDYKGYRFCGTIHDGGTVGNCSVLLDGQFSKVLVGRAFKTLTAWADACIQEHLQEYGTRYSAWKRVKHLTSGKNMDAIFGASINQNATKDSLIECLQQKLADAQKKLDEKESAQSNGSETGIQKSKKPASKQRIITTSMDSPYGAYLVLQRMSKVSPESIEDLKKYGLLEFRKMIHEFTVNDHGQLYEPIDQKESETWYKDQRRPSDRAVANYVYDFFKK